MRYPLALLLIALTMMGGALPPSSDSLDQDYSESAQLPDYLAPSEEVRQINYLRLSLFGATAVTGLGVSISRMNEWWGHGYVPFHIKKDDWSDDNLAQTDEISHFMISYKIAQAGTGLSRWSGLSDGTSRWIGGGIALGIMLWVEYPIDAHNPLQGFGVSDMIANCLGVALALSRDKWFDELSFLDVKVSVKDFSQINNEVIAQTFAQNDAYIYWLTARPSREFPVHVSLGYSANHENEDRIAEREIYLGFGTSLNEIAGLIDPRLFRRLDTFSFYEISFYFRINN